MTTTQAFSTAPTGGLRRALKDAWVITRRDLDHWVRQPVPLLIGLAFPVLIFLMFGYLFGGAMAVPGGGDYREFLLPGMFAMTMLFGIEATMSAVATDASRGVTDRFRSLPMAPSAVVVGRSAADMLNAGVGLAVMLGFGLVVGWRAHDSLLRALAAVGLLLLLRFAFVWVGIWLGLVVRDPQAVVAVQILVWPLGFTSSAYVDPATMPGWLGTLAAWNPLSATVGATRELFGNAGGGGESAMLLAVAWPLLLVAIFLPLAVRRYQRLGR